jgi:hypothetical protein
MKNEQLNIMEKIAMIWTLPLAIVISAALIAVSITVYLLRVVFVYSGTAGSAIWIVNKIRETWNAKQWANLRRRDQQTAELDKIVNS